ncbi:MAG: DUF58 domain-containing protein [Gemmatimonadota bacterium]
MAWKSVDGGSGSDPGAAPWAAGSGVPPAAAAWTSAPPPEGVLQRLWRRIRGWRRLRFTRAGLLFSLGALAVGFVATNTGNNLLFLLLGAMLGAMVVSGWLSERTLSGLKITRLLPAGTSVQRDVPVRYQVTNQKRHLTSFAVELSEKGLASTAFVARVPPGTTAEVHAAAAFHRRGVYSLHTLTLATEFPFALFRKERDVELVGEVVIWPRTDRRVPDAGLGAGRSAPDARPSPRASAGPRGEFRSLREYRLGDDARDIHWRTSARLHRPVIREYERDAGEPVWIVLDVSVPPGDEAERALEVTASMCARAAALRRPFALAAGPYEVGAGTGEGQLERALDALARVEFGVRGVAALSVPRGRAILVTSGESTGAGFSKVVRTAVPVQPEAS